MAPLTEKHKLRMRFEVFTAVKIWIVVVLVMTPCSVVGGYQRFGGTCFLHFQGRSTSTHFCDVVNIQRNARKIISYCMHEL
jgi:hypothetical protein